MLEKYELEFIKEMLTDNHIREFIEESAKEIYGKLFLEICNIKN